MQTFISYRHSNSKKFARKICTRLVKKLGSNTVFRDEKDVDPGNVFSEKIATALETCDSFAVIIGPRWARVTGVDGGLRLSDPDDFVRAEVRRALERRIPVFPVLVNGAEVPRAGELPEDIRELAGIQALTIRGFLYFRSDVGKLVGRLKGLRPKLRRCWGLARFRRCDLADEGFFCARHARQPVYGLLLAGFTAVGGIAWLKPDVLVPAAPALEIVKPADGTEVPEASVPVSGHSPYKNEPHYLVVRSPQERFVVGDAFKPAWDGSWRGRVTLGSGVQGAGDSFGIQVVTTRARFPEGPFDEMPPDARVSPEVSVHRRN